MTYNMYIHNYVETHNMYANTKNNLCMLTSVVLGTKAKEKGIKTYKIIAT